MIKKGIAQGSRRSQRGFGVHSTLHFLSLWGSLVAIAILYSDCAVTPIEVKSEMLNPAEAGKHSIAVLPDPYMDNLTAAQRLVDLVRIEMTRRGFRLSQTENSAELVIIPCLTAPASGDPPAKPLNPVPRINLIGANIGEPGMMQNTWPLGELPQWENRPLLPQERIQLTILAVQEAVWHKALNINQLRIPQVWRISVFLPTDFSAKGKEVTAEMVGAAGPRFAELAGR
jgi:hypothetical protein